MRKMWDKLDSIEIVGAFFMLVLFGYGIFYTIEALIKRFF